jgi:uncharacterized membrane protein
MPYIFSYVIGVNLVLSLLGIIVILMSLYELHVASGIVEPEVAKLAILGMLAGVGLLIANIFYS